MVITDAVKRRIERITTAHDGWLTLRLDDGSSLETTTDALWTVKR